MLKLDSQSDYWCTSTSEVKAAFSSNLLAITSTHTWLFTLNSYLNCNNPRLFNINQMEGNTFKILCFDFSYTQSSDCMYICLYKLNIEDITL